MRNKILNIFRYLYCLLFASKESLRLEAKNRELDSELEKIRAEEDRILSEKITSLDLRKRTEKKGSVVGGSSSFSAPMTPDYKIYGIEIEKLLASRPITAGQGKELEQAAKEEATKREDQAVKEAVIRAENSRNTARETGKHIDIRKALLAMRIARELDPHYKTYGIRIGGTFYF
jgi:hypothetical protein